jgi:SAM-dependent methyltransferase
MAARVLAGAAENLLLPFGEKWLRNSARQCPVCNWRGWQFRSFLSGDEVIRHCICPGCGSFDRQRLLVLGLRVKLRSLGQGPAVMVGFSLSAALRFLLEHEGLARCFRCDVDAGDPRFAPDFAADLRRTPLRDDSVDWVFCSHVLEHIGELDLCVNELLRILRSGGTAWLQVPFEPGLAHSRRIPVDPYRAHAHAWQFAPDFGTLLERQGWSVTEVVARDTVPRADRVRFGIDPDERYWVVRKN